MDLVCINIDDSGDKKQYRLTTAFESAGYGERAVVDTFKTLLYDYLHHPESKSLSLAGEPCNRTFFGVLQFINSQVGGGVVLIRDRIGGRIKCCNQMG
jgi:hypothetical protein